MTPTRLKLILMAVALSICASGCRSARQDSPKFEPRTRAVHIDTIGCGLAADRSGSGVVVADDLVLTVAHLVARAQSLSITNDQGEALSAASVVSVDPIRDLALIRADTAAVPYVTLATATAGTTGNIVAAANSGDVAFEVKQVARVTVEEVLGTESVSRIGYELAATTATGDSGAGAYDEANRLIGLVFATGSEGDSSWITSSSEVQTFLRDHGSQTNPIVCDPQNSRLDLP